eukprot:COSAG04_NODE_1044_length_8579_cov_3.865802_1_plen_101_part_10
MRQAREWRRAGRRAVRGGRDEGRGAAHSGCSAICIPPPPAALSPATLVDAAPSTSMLEPPLVLLDPVGQVPAPVPGSPGAAMRTVAPPINTVDALRSCRRG